MSNAIKEYILSALADGRDFEDIAIEFSNTLNEIEDSTKVDPRIDYLNNLLESFDDAYDESNDGTVSPGALADYITFCLGNKVPSMTNYTVEQLEGLRDFIISLFDLLVEGTFSKSFDLGKTIGHELINLVGGFFEKEV